MNTPAHLERALKPIVVFADIANAWEAKRLPELKESSRYTAPKLHAKHMRPFFGQMTGFPAININKSWGPTGVGQAPFGAAIE